jgi:hypothetical protein
MTEHEHKAKNKNKAIGIAVAVVGALVLLYLSYGFGGIQQGLQRTLPPDVDVTSKNARTGNIGLDYTVWIDVSVHNSGGAGTVTVWTSVIQGSDEWTKSQSIYLDAKDSRNLTFEFREASFWSFERGSYNVWVTS